MMPKKHRVKLCIFCENAVFVKMRLYREIINLIYNPFFDSEHWPCLLLNDAKKHRVKLCIFCENAVFVKLRLYREIINLIYNPFFYSEPWPCLLLNDAKKKVKNEP